MFSLIAGGLVLAACMFAFGYVVGHRRGGQAMLQDMILTDVGRRLKEKMDHEIVHGDGSGPPSGTLTASDEPEMHPMSKVPEHGREIVVFRITEDINLPVCRGKAIVTVNDVVITSEGRSPQLWSGMKSRGANGWVYLD